jgi:hypothetical protein
MATFEHWLWVFEHMVTLLECSSCSNSGQTSWELAPPKQAIDLPLSGESHLPVDTPSDLDVFDVSPAVWYFTTAAYAAPGLVA